ncbi:MAG: LLM class flavin-dependent oxidoreductase, partial [Bacteroidota bacterium]
MQVLDKIAKESKLTLGLVFPLESYKGSVPKMERQEELAQLAEEVGFQALWFRDVPLHDPSFGDAGQMFDPWIYMTHIMNHTQQIALATGSIILPLRHPIHTAKSIQSLQTLSQGRIIVGIASGDRPIEYPAFDKDIQNKSALFRDSFNYLKSLEIDFPVISSPNFGSMKGNVDLLPKSNYITPYLVT